MPQDANRFAYTIGETAELTTISKSQLYRLIRSDQLRIVKVGARTLIPAAELRRLISEGADIPNPAA